MQFEVGMNSREVEAMFKNFPKRCKAAIADGIDHSTRSFFKNFYSERLQGPPGITAKRGGIFHRFRRTVMVNGERVYLKQGAGQAKTTAVISKSADNPLDMQIEMYSQSQAAGKLETGGSIHSQRGLMPIPLNQKAINFIKANLGWGSLELMKINGKLFLGLPTRNGKPDLLFILVRNVKVKPRLGFYMTWDKYASRREEIMNKALDNALEKM